MDLEAILALTPEQVAEGILVRRQLLKDLLPMIIQRLEESHDQLVPMVEKATAANRDAQHRVADLRKERDEAHGEARALREEAEVAASVLEADGGMMSLDPKWKKDRLMEQLEEIDKRIETTALDHRRERSMLKERQKLIEGNEEWLKERRSANPEMTAYVDARRRMNRLYKTGNTSHKRVIEAMQKAEPVQERFKELRTERIDTERQLHRARSMLGSAEQAVEYWERRLIDGFGELEPGFEDLLADAARVREGAHSTSALRRDERLARQEEEE